MTGEFTKDDDYLILEDDLQQVVICGNIDPQSHVTGKYNCLIAFATFTYHYSISYVTVLYLVILFTYAMFKFIFAYIIWYGKYGNSVKFLLICAIFKFTFAHVFDQYDCSIKFLLTWYIWIYFCKCFWLIWLLYSVSNDLCHIPVYFCICYCGNSVKFLFTYAIFEFTFTYVIDEHDYSIKCL